MKSLHARPRHHAFVIEAEEEEGAARARSWASEELGLEAGTPDIVERRYGLLTVEAARQVVEGASGTALSGDTRVVIITASRAYHEAQNALLKLFEEPPPGVYLFLILPSLGGLLPTLRSRVQMMRVRGSSGDGGESLAHEFLNASTEKKAATVKRLSSGRDEDDRREKREEAIALLNDLEALLSGSRARVERYADVLSQISTLRGYLYDRSAPTKMILEHLSLVIPTDVR